MKRSDSAAYPSRALAKGFAILAQLSKTGGARTLADISRAIELGKPSTLRLVRTLEELGYIARENGRIRICKSPAVAGDAFAKQPMLDIQRAAADAMKGLAIESGETVTLAALSQDHVRVVKVLESPRQMRMSNYTGRILQPYASSLGKAIAAFQPDTVRRQLVNVYGLYAFTAHTITDPAEIEAEFAKVRSSGFAYDIEETVEGGCCVAVPIRSHDGSVSAAISISQPKNRYSEDKRQKLEVMLRSAADAIGV